MLRSTDPQASVCTLTVDNEKLPNMTPEMQIQVYYFVHQSIWVLNTVDTANSVCMLLLQVLQSALFTFDLIESVLARIEEITEAKERPLS